MTMSAHDRVALILGRAIMRGEALQVQLEEAHQKIGDLEEQAREEATSTERKP